jgi:hypothetical protein
VDGDGADAGISGYLICLSGDVLVTPAMDFTAGSAETLSFMARTYGGVVSANNTITVSVSTNNGSSWTSLGTRTPRDTTLTAMAPFDLSAYNHSQVQVKLETLGATASVGAGLDEVLVTNLAGGITRLCARLFEPDGGGDERERDGAGGEHDLLLPGAGGERRRRERQLAHGQRDDGEQRAGGDGAGGGCDRGADVTHVGGEFEYLVTATEPDADTVTFACTSAVDGATWDFDANTGDFLFIPTANQMGTNLFSFTATDKDGTSAPVQMSVKVYSAAATNDFTQWVEDEEEDPADPTSPRTPTTTGTGRRRGRNSWPTPIRRCGGGAEAVGQLLHRLAGEQRDGPDPVLVPGQSEPVLPAGILPGSDEPPDWNDEPRVGRAGHGGDERRDRDVVWRHPGVVAGPLMGSKRLKTA